MNKKQKVKFIPKNADVEVMVAHPRPSKLYIPTWFKNMPKELPTVDNKGMDKTAKKCLPFIDSLTSGYTQELTCDVKIVYKGKDEQGNDLLDYQWAGDQRPFSTRIEDTNSRRVFPEFNGYYNVEFHWNSFWEPQTPAGYSTVYSHPANRLDLPFTTLTGIIDTDKWSITGPVPFLLRRGFEGLIPAGTPIYQMMFIKRESWESKPEEFNEKFQKKHTYAIRQIFGEGYKKKYWSKKDFT